MLVFIGIDDTDVLESPGTGRVARNLAEDLQNKGMGVSKGVTRHQLLVHPAIPYTSHNSSLCIALEATASVDDLEEASKEFLLACAVEGADPGLCVARQDVVTTAMEQFGKDAQVRLLTTEQAYATVPKAGVKLRSIAGGPQGVIGALAAVGLRAFGTDGRYVEVAGVREVHGVVPVKWLLAHTDVLAVVDDMGRPLGNEELVDTQDWVRPSLVSGNPVLKVRQNPNVDPNKHGRKWIPYESRRRSSHQNR